MKMSGIDADEGDDYACALCGGRQSREARENTSAASRRRSLTQGAAAARREQTTKAFTKR
jgi:hypothetical protein